MLRDWLIVFLFVAAIVFGGEMWLVQQKIDRLEHSLELGGGDQSSLVGMQEFAEWDDSHLTGRAISIIELIEENDHDRL